VTVHHYLREGGAKLTGKPGSPEFAASYDAAIAKLKTAPEGQFQSILSRYKASSDFTKLRASTRSNYEIYLRRIKDEFGDLPIAALADPAMRGDFLEWRDDMSSTPRAADYAWTTLARVLSWAKNRSIIASNPCERGGRLYKGGKRAKIIWMEPDLRALAAVASLEVMAAVLLALWTGQRQGDLLAMPWSAYDGRSIKLVQSKTNKSVAIPVGDTLRRFLDGMKRQGDTILVSSTGNPWTKDGFKSSFYRAVERAGIDDRHFHDLRGTAVTRLALSECSVPQIASITGHSLRDVEAILDAHYLGGRVELAEQAALKLESRYGETHVVAD
jgi:integrase